MTKIYTDPNWEPLRAALDIACTTERCDQPADCPLDAWMWMYRDGTTNAYKHRDTRKYLYLETSPCGCTRDVVAGRVAAKCALHTIGAFACCVHAQRLPCVCYEAFRCQKHGEKHIGSHD